MRPWPQAVIGPIQLQTTLIISFKQQNNEYDAVTNHGATQGVTFGPTNKNFVNPDKQDSLDVALLQGKSRKTVAERFAELNKIKKNATK